MIARLFLSHEFIEFIEFIEFFELPQGGKPAIGDGVWWTTCKRKAKPEAQLGDRRNQSDEPRGRLWRESTGRDTPPFDTHDTIRQAIGEVFFRRSRLFVIFHPTQAPLKLSQPQIKIAEPFSRIALHPLSYLLRIIIYCMQNLR